MSYSNLIDTSRWIDLVWRHLGEEFSYGVDCGEDKVEALVVSKWCGVAGSGVAEDANGKIRVAPIPQRLIAFGPANRCSIQSTLHSPRKEELIQDELTSS